MRQYLQTIETTLNNIHTKTQYLTNISKHPLLILSQIRYCDYLTYSVTMMTAQTSSVNRANQ